MQQIWSEWTNRKLEPDGLRPAIQFGIEPWRARCLSLFCKRSNRNQRAEKRDRKVEASCNFEGAESNPHRVQIRPKVLSTGRGS